MEYRRTICGLCKVAEEVLQEAPPQPAKQHDLYAQLYVRPEVVISSLQ